MNERLAASGSLRELPLPSRDSGTTLGPAQLVTVEGRDCRLRFSGRVVSAHLATAFPCRPQAGDTVLAISQGEACYVIGLLQSREPAVLEFPGDMELRTPNGELRLTSGTAVKIAGPEVEVEAGRLELRARSLIQRALDAFQSVRNLFEVRAGRARTVVEGSHYQKAERSYLLAEKEVKIDGERINLG